MELEVCVTTGQDTDTTRWGSSALGSDFTTGCEWRKAWEGLVLISKSCRFALLNIQLHLKYFSYYGLHVAKKVIQSRRVAGLFLFKTEQIGQSHSITESTMQTEMDSCAPLRSIRTMSTSGGSTFIQHCRCWSTNLRYLYFTITQNSTLYPGNYCTFQSTTFIRQLQLLVNWLVDWQEMNWQLQFHKC